jgi:selenocysteine-specific translation elongation factor
MAEYAKLNAAKPDKHPGELDTVGRKEGFVLHSYEVDREKPKTLLKNASLSNYQFVDSVDQLKHEMGKLRPKWTDGSAVIPIDHAFDIKGIGMVVLGVVKEGMVRAYDELALAPGGKKILVKSIQDA